VKQIAKHYRDATSVEPTRRVTASGDMNGGSVYSQRSPVGGVPCAIS